MTDAGSKVDYKTEVLAGVTTFSTLSYIVVVNPAILSGAGMPFESVLTATCLAAGLACVLMGIFANAPIALAPGMGLNAFFVYNICLQPGKPVPWQTALGMVFLSGIVMLAFTASGLRMRALLSFPKSFKSSISVGIGLFLALIGLENSGIVSPHPITLITMGKLDSASAAIFGVGLLVSLALLIFRVKLFVLAGIASAWLLAMILGKTSLAGADVRMPVIGDTLGALNIGDALKPEYIPLVLSLFLVDTFDCLGTNIGVLSQAKITDEKIAGRALFIDGIGTTLGSIFGTSTVTSYIESSAGVATGGRTGITAITCGILLLLAASLAPLLKTVAGCAPITAPALVIVGYFMMKEVVHIEWEDVTEAVPAFLTIIVMPMTFGIHNGLFIGIVSYVLMKLIALKPKDVPVVLYVFGALIVAKFVFLG